MTANSFNVMFIATSLKDGKRCIRYKKREKKKGVAGGVIKVHGIHTLVISFH